MITPEMSIAEVCAWTPKSLRCSCLTACTAYIARMPLWNSIAEASLVHGIDATALVAALNEYFADKEGK